MSVDLTGIVSLITEEPSECINPECKSSNIEAGDFQSEGGGMVWRKVSCNDCETSWYENFKFSSVEL